ncbi:MAG: hypothetical protein WC460_06135 [Patescibacteria group bacterium]
MFFDILIAIADKILPEVIKKFIPLVKIQPRKIKFTASEWTSNFSFFLYSRSKQVLFDIYVLIEIGDAKSEDFEISKTDSPKELKISIGNIEFNYEVLRLNCKYENNGEFILLKIAQIDPGYFMPFNILANIDNNIKLRILKYSKKQVGVLQKSQAGAVTFEIPLKTKEKINLKSVSILMKKNITSQFTK